MVVPDRVNNGSLNFFSKGPSSVSATQEDGQKVFSETKKLLVLVDKLDAINGSVDAKKAQAVLMDCIKKIDGILNNHQKMASNASDNTVVTESTPSSMRPR